MDAVGPPASTPTRPIRFIGAFESTFLPGHDSDVAESTQHVTRWRADLDAAMDAGVHHFRHALRWHRIEAVRGRYDWAETDAVFGHLRRSGAEPIVDLVHHTSYPVWLADGFRDPQFGPAYVEFAEAVARRYPWLTSYTLFNEPFATLFLAGHEALWPPYDRGVEGLTRLVTNVLPAISEASHRFTELLPEARHLWVDTCEHHQGAPGADADYAAVANDRRFTLLDLALGRNLDPSRPFLAAMLEAGGESLLELRPVKIDVVGMDYYSHSEWWYDEHGGRSPSPHPIGFAALARQYSERYDLPVMLSETNVRGLPSDRASWLRYMLEQYETATAAGIPLEGFCWFPSVDSCDWDSLLARPAGRVDPVGVRSLGADGERLHTVFTDVFEAAVSGVPSAQLPAYRFHEPCAGDLAGFLPHLQHWRWQAPPIDGPSPAIHVPPHERAEPMSAQPHQTEPSPPDPRAAGSAMPDLVVLSHLRWTWVWQRPQHLVSRFARSRAADGAHTWFVEEPVLGDVDAPTLGTADVGEGVTRVWLTLPRAADPGRHVGFDTPGAEGYADMLADLVDRGSAESPEVLLYTPMALDVAEALSPSRLYYDVMDDLASFRSAPQGLVLRHRRVLKEADAVFAGGRSLHRSVLEHRSGSCLLAPSGVETAHFAGSKDLRTPRERPVAGYVGVIDERLDLDLLRELALALPDWTLRVVGPVAKIEEADLPRAENIEYPGMAAYEDLPEVLAGFDVALMPFAINEATRSISPTKTLEYLAAGLPVVSTRVPDVVADYDTVVRLADDGPAFAAACRAVVDDSLEDRERRIRPIARQHEWDTIAERILAAMTDADAPAFAVVGARA